MTITPAIKSKKVNRSVMIQLDTLYRESHFGGRRAAYDGSNRMYTAGALPFTSKDFIVKLDNDDRPASSTSSFARYCPSIFFLLGIFQFCGGLNFI